MTLVANTVAMTTLAVHTLQPLIFYRYIDRVVLTYRYYRYPIDRVDTVYMRRRISQCSGLQDVTGLKTSRHAVGAAQ